MEKITSTQRCYNTPTLRIVSLYSEQNYCATGTHPGDAGNFEEDLWS
ncbi:MAG: hypothetical protein IJM35_03580 [Bacteroidales bacterium]|nr:hypothetical protein [Bacteroidales bacterium]